MKNLFWITCLFILAIWGTSCSYDYITFNQEPVDTLDTVYFAGEIEPIFYENNNCTACHKAGGVKFDLSMGNAYNSIISNQLVDTANPESSPLYDFPNPATSKHSWKKYTVPQAQLVLRWIKQGAMNNK